jgi:2-(1,2-epoxy-1,2-dihydrophenyl)acetyl-CoA isomerase
MHEDHEQNGGPKGTMRVLFRRRKLMDEPIRTEVFDKIATIRFNRPAAFNAFDRDMITSLADTLAELAKDTDVEGVIMTGEGKAFCAGGDLKWLAESGKSYGAMFHSLAARYHLAILEVRRMPKPVIAAINGLAAGGGFSLALACDFRVMDSSAILRQAYTSNGLSIDGGGTYSLPRMVGLARSMEIAAFDHPIPSQLALAWGLVTDVVPDGHSLKKSVEMIQEICRRPVSSFAASKRLFIDSFNTSFERQLEKEREFLAGCADHPNGKEGIEAFLQKRKPCYV